MNTEKTVTDRPKPKINRLAIVSIVLAILFVISYILAPILNILFRTPFLSIYIIMPGILGFLFGLVSFIKIKKNKAYLREQLCAVIGILISVVGVSFIFNKEVMPYIREKKELASKTEAFYGDSTNLKQTIIVPTLDTPIQQTKNIIWCSSFQLAWNELRDNVIGEPIQINGEEQLCDRLNNAEQTSSDLSSKSYYATAGFVNDNIEDKIQREMAELFPAEPVPQFQQLPIGGILAYSYLEANIKFTVPFRKNKDKFTFTDSNGDKTAIDSFGVWKGYLPAYQKALEQVEVLYFSPLPDSNNLFQKMKEFAVDLCSHTNPNQIVLACIEPKNSLGEMLTYIQNEIADFSVKPELHKLDPVDSLIVPDMFWKIDHNFTEFKEKTLANPSYIDMPILKAMQTIKFKLDRSGAILKSEAQWAVGAVSRHFVFDRPFLIYMKKRGADYPFFVMWVDNAELLSKSD